jgi:hypothetical protein
MEFFSMKRARREEIKKRVVYLRGVPMLMRSSEVWEHPGVPLPQENTLGRNLPYNKTHWHNIR